MNKITDTLPAELKSARYPDSDIYIHHDNMTLVMAHWC